MITEFMQAMFLQDERVHDSHRLIWLAYRAHELSPCHEPPLTNEYLELLTGLSRRTIQYARKQLQEWGYEIPPQASGYVVIGREKWGATDSNGGAIDNSLGATDSKPPQKTAPKPKKAGMVTSLQDSGFRLDGVAYAYFAQHAPNLDAQQAFENFCDYHTARATKFADWHAAWRTWTRKSVQFAKPNYHNGGRPATQPVYHGIEI